MQIVGKCLVTYLVPERLFLVRVVSVVSIQLCNSFIVLLMSSWKISKKKLGKIVDQYN